MASTAKVLDRSALPSTRRTVSAWLIGPWMLAAVVSGAALVLRGPDRIFGVALAALIGTSIAWILVSVLWPARPDRTCPECGREELRRLDARSTRGVVCAGCGHRDAERSSFLLAEDDGDALEPLRIAERSPRRIEVR